METRGRALATARSRAGGRRQAQGDRGVAARRTLVDLALVRVMRYGLLRVSEASALF